MNTPSAPKPTAFESAELQPEIVAAACLKALAHPERLALIKLLDGVEMSVGGLEDQLELPQASISHHLAKLRDSSRYGGPVHHASTS